ncbi:unnamed protein product [Adineta ricciae]|uniref:Cell division cycle protein 123 homolog n=1 Tax=Adineta ricciae TaxID=249248 RepID=A0A814CKY9_ADIRI|nr:unnamed protein product [Adineta ricciae]
MGQYLTAPNNGSKSKDNQVDKELCRYKLERQRQHIPFNVESWYPILKVQTFHTEFLSISPSIAQAFVNYYQARYNSKTVLFTHEHLNLIESIENQLKNKLFHRPINEYFIRLSSRSPKDGDCLNQQLLKDIYDQELHRLKENYPNEYDTIESQSNMQMIAFCSAQFECLKVTNEREALNLILSSERVFIDLSDALQCEKLDDEKIPWNNHLILRQWHSQLNHSMELRCVVYQSKLTAISQYNHYCKFYHLQDQLIVQKIKLTIEKYFQDKIRMLFERCNENYSNYIIDVGLMVNGSTNEFDCIVIELNPFDTSTGASLFNWTNDEELLTGKQNDVEIRVRGDYYPNIQDLIEFIHQENSLKTKNDRTDDHQPYFLFLDKMKNELSQ